VGSLYQPMLFAQDLSRSYRDSDLNPLPIIENISFELPQNKIVGILGASGCGKTTLLKIVAGLDRPSSGEILSELKRPGPKIGFLQQGERLLPWRTVIDNVALGLELCGETSEAARVLARQILRTVEMDAYQYHFPAQLSGGMTQRVLLARTLITKPTLLLLDEPLGQLDIIGRKSLAMIIRNYIDEHQATALLVTYSVEEAVFISDYILTLSRRPAKIIKRFNLTDQSVDGFDQIRRASSYELVLNALLLALKINNEDS